MKRSTQALSALLALLAPTLAVHAVDNLSWGDLKAKVAAQEPAMKKAGGGKVDICHQDGDGLFHLVNISTNAVDAHLANHGDVLAGAWYADVDGDGFGDASGTAVSCPSAGLVDNNGDTDDSDASINPDAPEVCGDGIDNNSNGEVDEGCVGGCGPTDCTGDGTCLSDSYSDAFVFPGYVDISASAGPESFTTDAGVCYTLSSDGTNPGVTRIGATYIDGANILHGVPAGLLSLFGGGYGLSTLTTTLLTTPGATYQVSFVAREVEFGTDITPRHEITLSAIDAGGGTVKTSGAVVHPLEPTPVSFEFVAGAGSVTTLAIQGTYLGNNANQDFGFDDLVVTRLP